MILGLIHFDGWDLEYDYWVTPSSPYIHPKGIFFTTLLVRYFLFYSLLLLFVWSNMCPKPEKQKFSVKVWVFWEGHKISKHLRRTFDKSVVFCAHNSVLVKKLTKIFKNKCGQVVLYKLWNIAVLTEKKIWKIFGFESDQYIYVLLKI